MIQPYMFIYFKEATDNKNFKKYLKVSVANTLTLNKIWTADEQ